MRILVTNDDGINAPGLAVLEEIAADLAGPGGEVWVVAPAFEQSGVAHAISYTNPTMIARLGERRFAAEGSPADCVLAAVSDAMDGMRPDLVLSGINRGNNSGENVAYSGTVGGAMEAALQGLPAVALSQFMGPRTAALADPFDAARAHGANVIRRLLTSAPWDQDAPYPIFYNVNFPPCAATEVQGVRPAPQGRRAGTRFGVEPFTSPTGRRFLWVRGGAQDAPAAAGTDVAVNLAGCIAVTPMRADLTCQDALRRLRSGFDWGEAAGMDPRGDEALDPA